MPTNGPRFPRLATLLLIQGVILEIVAAIHFIAYPMLRGFFQKMLAPEQFAYLWPPSALNHAVVGILLIPIGLTTMLASRGIRGGERWAWRVALINAITLLALPVALAVIMGLQYFSAPAFLLAATLITLVSASMWIPLLVYRRDFL